MFTFLRQEILPLIQCVISLKMLENHVAKEYLIQRKNVEVILLREKAKYYLKDYNMVYLKYFIDAY